MTIRNADPIHVGHALKALRERYPDKPMHELADMIEWDDAPMAEQSTVGMETAKKYQAELLERSKNGDKYAMSMLNGNAFDEPGDD